MLNFESKMSKTLSLIKLHAQCSTFALTSEFETIIYEITS